MQLNFIQDVPLGYVQTASGAIDTATALSAIPAVQALLVKGAVMLLISAETQNVRWRDDGNNPTTTTGNPMVTGVERFFTMRNNNLKFIAVTAGAILNVTAYGNT